MNMRQDLKSPLFLLTLCVYDVTGQPTFERYFHGAGTAQVDLNEMASGNMLTGIAFQSGTTLMDPQGEIINQHCYSIDSFLVLQSVKRFTDNEFYFVGAYQRDSCSTSAGITIPYTHPSLGRMDSLGNVSSLHYFQMNTAGCWNAAIDLSITVDQEAILWGGGGPGIEWSFNALRSDTAGNLIWAKHFAQHGSFRFIKELPGGDLLAGMNMDTAGAVVARMDATGNFIWCKSYVRPRGMVHDCVIGSDSSFIITGFTDSIASTNGFTPLPPDYHPKLFMMKLDGSGDVQWCKGYDSSPYLWYARRGSHVVTGTDGNPIVLANLGEPGYNRPFRPFLMKTDLNGDTLWTRSCGIAGYSYATYSLAASSDGGVLFAGQGGPGTFLFKTDPMGIVPCHPQWHAVQVSDLFPVDSSFILSSIDGATSHPAFIGDTLYDPMEVVDGCTITAIPSVAPRKFSVRPNPNTGHFTVAFKDPLQAESYYSVYDALGKLLYQRPLAPGTTVQEVDLSRFGKGTYVIKCTDPGGVSYERVVVE